MPPIHAGHSNDWMWVDHETGRPSLARLDGYLDPDRLWRNWCAYRGEPITPTPTERPIVSAWSDLLLAESRLMIEIARDYVAFQTVFHEIAVPTILLHATSQVGVARGAVWWGAERNRPLDQLLAALVEPGAEFCHPIKFGTHGDRLVHHYQALFDVR